MGIECASRDSPGPAARRIAIGAWLTAVLVLPVACRGGGDNPRSPTQTAGGPVVRSAVPIVDLAGTFERHSYRTRGTSNQVFMTDLGGTNFELAFSGCHVTFADSWLVGGRRHLVVGLTDDLDAFTLYRVHDASGDGLPDMSTCTVVFTTPGPAYVTHVTPPLEGRAFALDARCQDLLRVTDANADGWPDTVAAVPFARSVDHPLLLQVRSLQMLGATRVVGFEGGAGFVPGTRNWVPSRAPGATVRALLFDLDGDGIAESVTQEVEGSRFPATVGRPFVGQTTVSLYGTAEVDVGRVAVVSAGPAGSPQILGSGALVLVDGAPQVSIPLSRPLELGEEVRLSFADAADRWARHTVIGAWPQILAATPAEIDAGAPASLTIQGLHFSASMELRARTPQSGQGSIVVPFTYLSPVLVVATLPPTAVSAYSNTVILWGLAPGQPLEDGLSTWKVRLRRP